MKITGVETIHVADGRPFLFVQVHTDEGISGIGESGLIWREAAVEGAIRHLAPQIIGQDPMRTEHLWQKMFRGDFFPADKVTCAAISAIDLALWDIKGKALNQPVYNLLGGLYRDKVQAYTHNYDAGSTEELVEDCVRATEQGWKFVRWRLGPARPGIFEPSEAVRLALRQVEAVRSAVGDEIEIITDAHSRFSPVYASRLARELEQYNVFYLEDALRSENPESYRKLRRDARVPLAAGEQWASKWAFRQAIEEELIDYARVDLCIVGGITEAYKIVGWAESHYIDLAAHNPLGPVSTAACLHLSLAASNVGVFEMKYRSNQVFESMFPAQVEWKDGFVLAPTAPGLGIEIDLGARDKYSMEKAGGKELMGAPEYRRLDGSFTHW
ncbi:mandelate racemase/muconate lactonizing enzyme family protein [Dactylosporangium sp. NPDC051484]|uniref:mandelate racemase/muconate lactonizing enzyme family protein n=1 Tax=Dactylosporangium sp. NPDC051484 TaxID=3154942 RepID=UPI0034500533